MMEVSTDILVFKPEEIRDNATYAELTLLRACLAR
jgi:hypothetical protein